MLLFLILPNFTPASYLILCLIPMPMYFSHRGEESCRAEEEELLMSNFFTQEALINLLEKKGVLEKTELLEEIRRLKAKKPYKL